MSRQTQHPFYVKFNGGWINTDAMWVDAVEKDGLFRLLQEPMPGAVIVLPSSGRGKYGHCGIVATVSDGGVKSVVHCSAGNYKSSGDAIQENGGEVLLGNSQSRYLWLEGAESTENWLRSLRRRYG